MTGSEVLTERWTRWAALMEEKAKFVGGVGLRRVQEDTRGSQVGAGDRYPPQGHRDPHLSKQFVGSERGPNADGAASAQR